MKKIQFCLLLTLCPLLLSCDKAIDEVPLARYSTANLTKTTLDALVTGAYEPLARSRGRLWESTIGLQLERMTEYGVAPAGDNYVNYNFLATRDGFAPCWTTWYETIGKANLLLKTLDDDRQLAQVDKDAARGEMLFTRALSYYWLVRLWGPIPLRLQPIANSNETALPVSDVPAVYAQIVKDLQIAETLLPAQVSAAKAGRATAGAAKLMLADIYLTTKDYANARLKAKEMMDNKAKYGYELVKSLATLFSPTLPTNSEDVFSIKFAQQNSYGSFLPTYAADSRAKDAGLAARGLQFVAVSSKAPLIKNWDRADLRRSFSLYDSVTITGVKLKATLIPGADYYIGKYRDPDAPTETGAGNDFYLYRYVDALLIFAEAENQLSGPTDAAYAAINQVRRRAYGLDFNTVSAKADFPKGLTKQQFDDLVFQERGYEFVYEGRRYLDLTRTGRATKFIADAGKPVPTLPYLLIPTVETANNPAIK
ncbi:MAG: RagB/SusD family nutrient uptake outer membrane protein [Spirosoma sp.]|nr:RagB/SusD family nutrient uptake outer membrane protein [Spirosoma sp.]